MLRPMHPAGTSRRMFLHMYSHISVCTYVYYIIVLHINIDRQIYGHIDIYIYIYICVYIYNIYIYIYLQYPHNSSQVILRFWLVSEVAFWYRHQLSRTYANF